MTYGLEALANNTAIFVAPQGMKETSGPFSGMTGFANTNGRDIKFFRAMLDYFCSTLCIDKKRVFSTGFSFGGMMSFAVGCAMHDVVRAIAPCSAAFVSGCDSTSKGPVALWQAHGTNDSAVPLSSAKAALRYFLARNGCRARLSTTRYGHGIVGSIPITAILTGFFTTRIPDLLFELSEMRINGNTIENFLHRYLQ